MPLSLVALLALTACGQRMTTDVLPGGIPARTDLHAGDGLPPGAVRTVARRRLRLARDLPAGCRRCQCRKPGGCRPVRPGTSRRRCALSSCPASTRPPILARGSSTFTAPDRALSCPEPGTDMTEQPKNTDFHDSSFLQGANAAYVEQLYGQWARNPAAVDQAWDAFFRGLGDAEGDAAREADGASWKRADWPPAPTGDTIAALTGEWPQSGQGRRQGRDEEDRRQGRGEGRHPLRGPDAPGGAGQHPRADADPRLPHPRPPAREAGPARPARRARSSAS